MTKTNPAMQGQKEKQKDNDNKKGKKAREKGRLKGFCNRKITDEI